MSDSPPNPEETGLNCPECDYNLTGAPSDRCPWCGWKIDLDVLASLAQQGVGPRRAGVVAAALVLGIGSMLAVAALISRGAKLSLYDGITVLGVLAAAGGHLYLAVLAALGGLHWPIRQRETGDVLRLVGWLSVVAGIAGAADALHVSPAARGVQGVALSGVLEFVLRAFFFALPGFTLLMLRMVSLSAQVCASRNGWRRQTGGSRAAGHGGAMPGQETQAIGSPAYSPGGAPFAVELVGRYVRRQLTQSWSDEPRPTTPPLEAIIARAWEAQCALAGQENRLLHNGKLGRLVRAVATSSCLQLELGSTCYRDFIGTNVHDSAMVREINPAALANPLGISVTLITRDGYLVYGRRSDRVACHAGFLHTFGGMLEAADRDENGYDIFGSAVRELHEETGIKQDEITDIVTSGLVRDTWLYQPELLFEATVALTRKELSDRFNPALSNGEHTGIEFVHDDPDAVVLLIEQAKPIAPVAQAALLLHGRHNWGAEWYEQTCYVLYGDLPSVVRPSG